MKNRKNCLFLKKKKFVRIDLNGTISACRYKQKQKGTENFPPASGFVCGLRNEISLKNYF